MSEKTIPISVIDDRIKDLQQEIHDLEIQIEARQRVRNILQELCTKHHKIESTQRADAEHSPVCRGVVCLHKQPDKAIPLSVAEKVIDGD